MSEGGGLECYSDSSKPKVKVLWDAMSDLLGCEEPTESNTVVLMPSKWNPKIDCDGAWRMDVEVDLGDDIFDDNVTIIDF